MKVKNIKIMYQDSLVDISDLVTAINGINIFTRNVLQCLTGTSNIKISVLNSANITRKSYIEINDINDYKIYMGRVKKVTENKLTNLLTVEIENELSKMLDYKINKDNLEDDIEGTDGLKKGTVTINSQAYKWVQMFHLLDTFFAKVGSSFTLDYSNVYNDEFVSSIPSPYQTYKYYKYLRFDVNMLYCVGSSKVNDEPEIEDKSQITYYKVFFEALRLAGLIIYIDYANEKYIIDKYYDVSNSTQTDNNTTRYTEKHIYSNGFLISSEYNGGFGYTSKGSISDYYQSTNKDIVYQKKLEYLEGTGINDDIHRVSILKNLALGFHGDYHGTTVFFDVIYSSFLNTNNASHCFYKQAQEQFLTGIKKVKYSSISETINMSDRTEKIDLKKDILEITTLEKFSFNITDVSPENDNTFTTRTPTWIITFNRNIDYATISNESVVFDVNVASQGVSAIVSINDSNEIEVTVDGDIANGTYYILVRSSIKSYEGHYLDQSSTETDAGNRVNFTINAPLSG